MGAHHSKTDRSGSKKDGKRSPVQEKHTSADSTAPLAVLNINRSSTVDKRVSFGEKSMGRSRTNTMSFHGSTHTADSLATPPTAIHDLDGHSNVSRPPPPPRLHHLSELIDPEEVPFDGDDWSPSGHLLAPEEYLVHPDRPLSIRERQEEIRQRVRAASRLGAAVAAAENARVVAAAPVKEVSIVTVF
ncbi:hypothetical protein LTR91_023464 [Friedmanniomyces endolithicus]|uniref:Uncharacterized protein n=1 Tax=Friedmanniomyces endolithicus TaxID=329885 RepID=A0AAN6H8W6_9PEZI|nr:hypothetical protein LTR94_004720 [Friedmanniomyces endolithicus]KAK0773807.1 hypothetical protein LTR59_015142 [Friedmanniomyces endolithicus]KAK0788659.1 hypothetical protein LTR38_011235 [Friedmanniomyces endolithicus]KAK0828387.1 hypothetical protein LTR03_016552 [Friedmanniomyces endolithicus]KAK0886585.1 hypothetical protein LTR02_018004 [Friedmanniomyces endolithicus]